MVNKCVLEDWFHYQITNPLSLIQFSVYIECVLFNTYMMELNTATANLEVLKMIQTKNLCIKEAYSCHAYCTKVASADH